MFLPGTIDSPQSAIRYLTFLFNVLLFHSPIRLLYVHCVSNVETRIRRARGRFRILILCLSYCSFISRFCLARLYVSTLGGPVYAVHSFRPLVEIKSSSSGYDLYIFPM
jgi:hypothetical protein